MRGAVAVVEDDAGLRGTLRRGLEAEGFSCVWLAATAAEALALAGADPQAPDALLLDLGLPDADGLDLLGTLRSRGLTCPAMALTGRTSVPERLSGFGAGVDDYVTKPFALAEVAARLDVLVRRNVRSAPPAGGLQLDPLSQELRCDGRAIGLSPLEFRLLGTLIARHGAVVRRTSLIAAGWPEGAIVNANTLDSYMTRLRRVLRAVGAEQTLEVVRGVGYRLGR